LVTTALTLSLITTGGFLIIYHKLPNGLKKLILKYPLATDITTLGIAYVLLGGTLTALMAAAMSGLLISILLLIAKQKERNINEPNNNRNYFNS
jgi:hypothetical protein